MFILGVPGSMLASVLVEEHYNSFVDLCKTDVIKYLIQCANNNNNHHHHTPPPSNRCSVVPAWLDWPPLALLSALSLISNQS